MKGSPYVSCFLINPIHFMAWIANAARKEIDKIITEKIKNFEGIELAVDAHSSVFVTASEVNGFRFLEFHVVGPMNLQLNTGCEVTINGNLGKIELESDNQEINTDFSETMGIGITLIEIDLEEELLSMITNDRLISIEVNSKKQAFTFEVKHQHNLQELLLKLTKEEAVEANDAPEIQS